MGDLKEVFRSLQELFPEVDHRMLKAITIEHHKDVDSAVVTVLDEVMPFMTGSAGVDGYVGNLSSMDGSVGNLFANHSTHEVGSSSSVSILEEAKTPGDMSKVVDPALLAEMAELESDEEEADTDDTY
ncbi:uncharacterized protein [Zea mays]|uniref:Uncharacterized protein n=1 Tax=Zea mays TaxID=4577 RepID=A0A1D6F7S8_MAIZE|nr:uncharacterized protein LOC103649448 [Zea mays]ONM27279.1 hypothetical protein ZEAMMB73_Zm00001d007646 [Zea mays]|eukprot:XP_008671937.2 uncharacterized protein LOC103649448 [Zea mays]